MAQPWEKYAAQQAQDTPDTSDAAPWEKYAAAQSPAPVPGMEKLGGAPPGPAKPPIPDELSGKPQLYGAGFQNPRTGRISQGTPLGHGPLGILDSPITGVQKIAEGAVQAANPNAKGTTPTRQIAGGVSKIIRGGMEAATPLLPAAGIAAPARTAVGLIAGTAAGKTTHAGLSAMGAPEEVADLGEDIAGIAAGSAAAKYGPKAGGAILTAADRMGSPGALERSAKANYTTMLTPSSKALVPEAERTAEGLVKTRPVALTRGGMMKKVARTKAEVGPLAGAAYDNKPPLDPGPVLAKLEQLRQQKAVAKGTGVVIDEGLNQAIDNIRDNIEAMRHEDGTIPASALDDYRDKLYSGNVSATGHLRQSAPQSAATIEKASAGAIKNYLDTAYPDVKPINDAYRIAAKTWQFLEEQRLAEIAAKSGVRTGSSSGFGSAVKKMIPAPLRSIPNLVSAAFDSVAWDSVNGMARAKVAQLIRKGSWDQAAEAMKPLPKLLAAPNQPGRYTSKPEVENGYQTGGTMYTPPPADASGDNSYTGMYPTGPNPRRAIGPGRGTIITPSPADASGMNVTTGEPLRAPTSRQLPAGPSMRPPSDLSGQAGDVTDLVPIKDPVTGEIRYLPRPQKPSGPIQFPRYAKGGIAGLRGPETVIVGDGGEPEAIIPLSKLRPPELDTPPMPRRLFARHNPRPPRLETPKSR